MRFVWIGLGLLAFGLGILGVVLPLLPTTPFMLLAAGCFAKGSPRLHAWLVAHKTFGPLIQTWRAHGAIPPRAKKLALSMIVVTYGISIALRLPAFALIPQGLVLLAVGTFIWTRPNGPRS